MKIIDFFKEHSRYYNLLDDYNILNSELITGGSKDCCIQ